MKHQKNLNSEIINFGDLDGNKSESSDVIIDDQEFDQIDRIVQSESAKSSSSYVKKKQLSVFDEWGDQSCPLVIDQEEDQQYSVEQYKNQLFKEKMSQNSNICVDVDSLFDKDDMNLEQVKRRKEENQNLNEQMIKRQIKRQKKLDQQRTNKQKNDMREKMQIQPNRVPKIKMMKKQTIISKKILELIAKKFDQFYAYENNFSYKGPKITLGQIGKTFGIGANSIHKLYTQWMDDPTFYDRLIKYDLYKKVPERKLTLERLQHVARLIKQNPFLTQNQLCAELNKIEDLKSLKDGKRQDINKSMIAKLLRIGKFKKKRVRCMPKEKNTSKSLQKRYDFCVKYKQLVAKKANIYFLDQSGFNLYMTRDKAWSRPNEQITVNCPISKGKRFSLIAIIGQQGLAHWRIIQGTYRKHEYLDFVKQLFETLNDRNKQKKEEQDWQQNWLIMDNCAIHDKQQTMCLAQRYNVSVMYLPAYSPQLNPIQMWFHQIKTKVRKINYSGERQLLEIMERTLKGYENYSLSNYYHGTLKFVEKGLRKEKF